jgi:toxin ParE1/3/4
VAEYRLTPAAEAELQHIWMHTAEKWSVDQAERYVDLLIAAFAKLAQFPELAPACDHIRPQYRSQVVERHIVYFQIADYGIAVIRILHDRMEPTRHL